MKFILACLAILAVGAALALIPPVLLLVALAVSTGAYVAYDRQQRS